MISKSSSVVDAALISCEKVAYVKSVIDSIVKLVNDLLHVPTCGHANNGNLLDDTDRIRDISPTRLMEQVILRPNSKIDRIFYFAFSMCTRGGTGLARPESFLSSFFGLEA